MDNLVAKVASIESDLHDHRKQLQIIESNAKTSIEDEVQGMQTALTDSDNKIQYVCSDVRACLTDIDYLHSDASDPLDLAPQMTWLSKRLDEIVSDFQTAQACTDRAIQEVNDSTYKILDVEQDVQVGRSQLAELESDGETLARNARQELRYSETSLEALQRQIAAKQTEIRTRTRELNAKRERKTELDSDIADTNRRIQEAEIKVRKKKDRAKISGGLGALGVLLAPATFGASLVLTAGAGVAVGVNLDDISSLRRLIQAKNTSVSSLQSEIAQADRDISNLEAQKRELNRLVTRCQSEVAASKKMQQTYHDQIQKTSQTKRQISILDEHASATTRSIAESKQELQTIKQNLDTCSVMLQEQSLELETKSNFLERFLGKTEQKKKEDFTRQHALLKTVSDTLDKIHTEIPALLPSSDTKLLSTAAWEAKVQPVVEVREAMPGLCF